MFIEHKKYQHWYVQWYFSKRIKITATRFSWLPREEIKVDRCARWTRETRSRSNRCSNIFLVVIISADYSVDQLARLDDSKEKKKSLLWAASVTSRQSRDARICFIILSSFVQHANVEPFRQNTISISLAIPTTLLEDKSTNLIPSRINPAWQRKAKTFLRTSSKFRIQQSGRVARYSYCQKSHLHLSRRNKRDFYGFFIFAK